MKPFVVAGDLVSDNVPTIRAKGHAMCEQEPQKENPSQLLKLADYLPLYETYRQYALQESNLISTRLNWILTINGFLYATYGFTLQKELEVTRSIHENIKVIIRLNPICYILTQAQLFMASIALVGICISLFGLLSIMAAQAASHGAAFFFNDPNTKAHKRVKAKYWKQISIKGYNTADGHWLPDIRGGGSYFSLFFGHLASLAIPFFLAISWVASLYVLYFVSIHNKSILCGI